jgi:phage head maturation protease
MAMIAIRGYLARFDDRAAFKGPWFERFARNSIINRSAPMRVAHSRLPGTTFSNANIMEDQWGFKFEAWLESNNRNRALASMIYSGVNGISVSFRSLSQKYVGATVVVERARLTEFSIVESPAYKNSRCWVVGDLSSAPPLIQALASDWAKGKIDQLDNRMQAAQPEEVECYPSDSNPFMFVREEPGEPKPKRLKDLREDPVRAAVRSYMASYLERGPK